MLRMDLLGEQSVTDDTGAPVAVRSSRSLALVAYLALHAGTPQSRQRIAGAFWPDSTGAQAFTNLRRELFHLRSVLGDDPSLVVNHRDLMWRDSETCLVDLRSFEQERTAALAAHAAGDTEQTVRHASAAVAWYRGDLLPGAGDEWLPDLRADLERACVELCDLLGEGRSALGDLHGAIAAVRRRVQLRPLEEVGYRTLMRLQQDLGDRAGAVSTFHRCASSLERELGVLPDPETSALYRRLIGTAGEDAATPFRAARGPLGTAGHASRTLVGRDRELAVLTRAWRAASTGRPGVVLVRGPAGVGKTRLADEVSDRARLTGAVVAAAECFGTSGQPALAPVADWLRNPDVRAATRALDPVWRSQVARLLPTTEGRGRNAGPRDMAAAWQRLRFFEGLARALLGTGHPLLLVLDNLQWCDEETLAFVAFCLRLAPDSRLLVVATVRDRVVDANPAVRDWTTRVRAAGLATEIDLEPLGPDASVRLAEAVAGRLLREPDRALLQAATAGFPLYIVEALGTWVSLPADGTATPDLTSVLDHRLGRASPVARAVSGLAATVGRDFSLDLLTEASDLDAEAVVRAVDELWRDRILHQVRDGYDFTHDLLREAAYRQVSPPTRWLLHRRVAQALELLHQDDPDTVSAQLAGQYARGGRADRAVSWYRRAADVAAVMFAHGESIRLSREALSLLAATPPSRGRDTLELSVLEAMAAPLNARYGYADPELQRTLERSLVLAEALGRRDSTLRALIALWASRFVQGRTPEAHGLASRALAMTGAGSGADPDSTASAHFAVGGSATSLGRPREAVRHLELATTLSAGALYLSIGTRADVLGTAWAAHAYWLLDEPEKARSSCARAIELARSADHPYSLAVALAYAGITHQLCRDAAAVSVAVSELRQLCDRYQFAYYRDWGLVLDGWCRGGTTGLDLARRGIENLRAEGSFARMPFWLSLLADLADRAGRPADARATLDAAVAAAYAHQDVWWLPEVLRMRAAYDPPGAAPYRLRQAADLAAAQGSIALRDRCRRDLARRPADEAIVPSEV